MDDGELVRVLKALSDPTRFRMVQEIAAAGELSCGQVNERFKLSQPTMSHHLKILTAANILMVRPEAKHHFLSVNHAVLNGVLALLPQRFAPNAARKTKKASSSV